MQVLFFGLVAISNLIWLISLVGNLLVYNLFGIFLSLVMVLVHFSVVFCQHLGLVLGICIASYLFILPLFVFMIQKSAVLFPFTVAIAPSFPIFQLMLVVLRIIRSFPEQVGTESERQPKRSEPERFEPECQTKRSEPECFEPELSERSERFERPQSERLQLNDDPNVFETPELL